MGELIRLFGSARGFDFDEMLNYVNHLPIDALPVKAREFFREARGTTGDSNFRLHSAYLFYMTAYCAVRLAELAIAGDIDSGETAALFEFIDLAREIEA